MAGVGVIYMPLCVSSSPGTTRRRFCFPVTSSKRNSQFHGRFNHISPRATSSSSSVGSGEHVEEPVTKVKFQRTISPPGSSTSLSLLGTGYRERVIVLFPIKVYAAGLYVDQSVFSKLLAWRGRPATEMQQDEGLFDTFFQAPVEKSLQIVLVRDVDGKTFWEALDESISPRISSHTPADESALSNLRFMFQGQTLQTQTILFLTWLKPDKMLISASFDGFSSSIDTTIEAVNVTSAIFDVFLGDASVSPSLKTSVAEGLSTALIQKA